jgi:hypothetical protein
MFILICYFTKAWEKALELSKILRGIYESQYDFEKLFNFLVRFLERLILI